MRRSARMSLSALLLAAALAAANLASPALAAAAQLTLTDLLQMAARVIAQGSNAQPIGIYGLKSYKVEEITLVGLTEINIDGETVVTDRAWRITVTGGPFPVRAIPPTLRIGANTLDFATETTDLRGVAAIIFDRSLLRDDAVISLAYGSEDPVALPERLKLASGGK